jgi:hypothetical protein
MAITREQVFEAADQIVAAGGTPTLAEVRKHLGGGSYTTISEAMKEWRATVRARTVVAPQPIRDPVPAAICDRFAEAAQDVWTTAVGLANERLDVRTGCAWIKCASKFEQEKQDAVALADQVQAELDVANAEARASHGRGGPKGG